MWVVLALVLVFVGLLIAGAIVLNKSDAGDRTSFAHILRRLAAEYGGEVRGDEKLFVRRSGFEATLDSGGSLGLFFTARPDGAYPGTLQVLPEGVGDSVAKFFGNQDIETGDAEFDALYVVRGKPEDFIRDVLGEESRALIRGLARRGDLQVMVNSRAFQIRLAAAPVTATEVYRCLDALLSCGLQIAESLPRVGSEGDVVVIETKREIAGTSCQICGTPLAGEIVECVRCTTLHHLDCWQFNGRCSTFACGSMSSRKAIVKET